MSLFYLESLSRFDALLAVVPFLFGPHFIIIAQSLPIQITHRVEVRLCTHLRLLNFLEFMLPFPQSVHVVAVDHFVDTHLLVFNVVVSPSLCLKCPLHAGNKPILGVDAPLVEFASVVDFGLEILVAQILEVAEVPCLVLVDFLHELLPPLQVFDAFVRLLLLLLQLEEPVLNLRHLVLLPLRGHDCVHHQVFRLLVGN